MRAALLAAMATGLATGLGAVPFLFIRELPRRAYDGILGLGAGLMLAAATHGLLAEALHGSAGAAAEPDGRPGLARLALIVAGFALGAVLASVMDRLIPHRHARGHHQHLGHKPGHDHHDRLQHPSEARRGYAIMGALTLHRVPEGLAIGAGFAAAVEHARLGLLLAIAVAVQNTCEGIVMAAPLKQGGVPAGRALAAVTLTGLTTPLAALVGVLVAGKAWPLLPFILAFAAGTLVYVISNEIIPESHSHGHEGTASGGLIVGFLLTIIIHALLP